MPLEQALRLIKLAWSRLSQPFAGRLWIIFECFAEVVIVVLFGIFPFLVAALRYNALSNPSTSFDFSTVFTNSFSGGQLFLYAFSLLGTLLWLSIFNWTIPYRLYRLALALVVIVIGFVIVALGGIDPTFSTIQNTAIVSLSLYCYAAYVTIYFLLLLGSKERPPSVRETLSVEVGEVIDRLRELEAKNERH